MKKNDYLLLSINFVCLVFILIGITFTSALAELPKKIKWKKDSATMTLIPSGSFKIGEYPKSTPWVAKVSVGQTVSPVETVEVEAFYMDIYEVTVGQFAQFVKETKWNGERGGRNFSKIWDDNDDPVARNTPILNINWIDALAYCRWAGKSLPTEAEWEYAARGGLVDQLYPWGNDPTVIRNHANISGIGGKDQFPPNANSAGVRATDNLHKLRVGTFEPNGYGLYDMIGNVAEWVDPWKSVDGIKKSTIDHSSPRGDGGGDGVVDGWDLLRGVTRGGAWNGTWNANVVSRLSAHPGRRGSTDGFRCVATSGKNPNKYFNISEMIPEKVDVSLSEQEVVVIQGVETSTTITITLKNQYGIFVIGETVNLTTDNGTVQTPAIDQGNGTYTAKYTAGNTFGEAKITAVTSNGKFGSATLKLLDTKVEIEADKTKLPAIQTATANITVSVKNSNGKLVKGETIKLTTDKGTIQTPIDNGDGTFSVKYTAVETAGNTLISVVTGSGKSATLIIELKELIVSKDKSKIENISGATYQTGKPASILVTLSTSDGLPISGREVILDIEPSENTKTDSSVQTDKDGKAIVSVTSGKPGVHTIKVKVGDLQLDSSVAVIYTGEEIVLPDANIVTIDSSKTILEADGKSTTKLTVTILDQNGKGFVDQNLKLEVGNGTLGKIVNNNDGTYNVIYAVGTQTGKVTIAAKTSNGKTGTIDFLLLKPSLNVKDKSIEVLENKPITFELEVEGNKEVSSITVVETPTNGKLEHKITNGKPSLTYTPNLNFNGQDNFKFKVSNGVLESKVSKVDITVNRRPVGLKFSTIDPVSIDQMFSIQVLVGEITNLAGWSFDLEYDPEILSVESVEEGDVLKSEGSTTFFQEGKTNNKEGTVTGLSSVYLGTGGVDTSGNLLTLNLKAIKDGGGYLRFKKVEFGDPKGKTIPIDTVDTTITVSSVPPCDVNADGSVNIFDLILVAQAFGQKVKTRVDTNGDGVVSIFDLIMVAQCFGQGAAPTIVSQPVAMFSMVENWVHLAEVADDGSIEFGQGIAVLKEILSSIKPTETVLMTNYPNPFNPETWIPYHLNQDTDVVVRIYDTKGRIVRTLDMGFQSFGYYASRDKAVYWNGKTDIGEKVSSGTYFYQIQAGDYTETRKLVILK